MCFPRQKINRLLYKLAGICNYDPSIGSTIRSSGTIDTNNLKRWKYSGRSYILNYQYYPDKGYVDYESKTLDKKNNRFISAHYKINIKPGYPTVDTFTGSIASRFVDLGSPGIYYLVIPQLKFPIAMHMKAGEKKDVTVTAGTFKVIRSTPSMGNSLIGKLLEPAFKNRSIWIEDSPRRLFIMWNLQ